MTVGDDSDMRLTRAVEEAERLTGNEVIVVGFARTDGCLDIAFRNAFVVALVPSWRQMPDLYTYDYAA